MKNPFGNLFKKKDAAAKPSVGASEKKKKSGFFDKFLKNRLGKSAVKGLSLIHI